MCLTNVSLLLDYCKRIIFSVYDIWQTFNFLLFSVYLFWWLIEVFINGHLAMYLIWRRDSTAKGAKKNTSPNVMRLQYTES